MKALLHGQRPRDLDARSLYLLPADRLHVSSTGEALVVTTGDGDVHRLPVQRLLRVVCNDRVHWSGAALALCQSRAICVTWLDGQGTALGHLWPARAGRSGLAEALDALAAEACTWHEVYGHWLRRRRLGVLQRWRQQRSAAGRPVDAAEWSRAKQAWVYRDEIGEHLPPLLAGMLDALVASRLADEGILACYWCDGGRAVEPSRDIARLVWAEMNLCCGAMAEALQAGREAAAVFEAWSGQCQGLVGQHLAALHALALRQLRA